MSTIKIATEATCVGEKAWHGFSTTYKLTAYDTHGLIYEVSESFGSTGQANIDKINHFMTELANRGYMLTLEHYNLIIRIMSHEKATPMTEQDVDEITGGCCALMKPGATFECAFTIEEMIEKAKAKARPKLAPYGFSC